MTDTETKNKPVEADRERPEYKITNKVMEILHAKQAMQEAIAEKGVPVDANTPLGDYPSLVAQIGSGMDGRDHIVYWSWLDRITGEPKNFAEHAYPGSELKVPLGFLDSQITPKAGHHPTLHKVPDLSVDLPRKVYQDEVRQSTYTMFSGTQSLDATLPFVAVRFRPTKAFKNAFIDLALHTNPDTILSGLSFKVMFAIDNINCPSATKTLTNLSNNTIYDISNVINNDMAGFSEATWYDKTHLLEISIEPLSMPEIFLGNVFDSVNWGHNDLVSTFAQDGNSFFHSDGTEDKNKADRHYAQQVEAIYTACKKDLLESSPINYRFPQTIKFQVNALSNLVNLTTFVFDSVLVPFVGKNLLRNSTNLEYLSTVDIDRTAVSYPSDNNSDALYNSYMFSNTGAKFLDIRGIPYIGSHFLEDAADLQVLPSLVTCPWIDPTNMYNGCVSLRVLPDLEKVYISNYLKSKIKSAVSFATDCKYIFKIPNYPFVLIGNDFCSGATNLAHVNQLPNTITSIGDNFMFNCVSIEYFTTDLYNLTVVGHNFLRGCVSLKSVFGFGVSLLRTGSNFMLDCNKVEYIEDFKKLERAEDGFLANNSSLKQTPKFPSTFQGAGTNFMYGCSSINIGWLSYLRASQLGTGLFDKCYSLDAIYVPDGEVPAYRTKFPHIPPSIFYTEQSQIVHTVCFSWLEQNPDIDNVDVINDRYSLAELLGVKGTVGGHDWADIFPYTSVNWLHKKAFIHKKVFVKVKHGEACPIPSGFPKEIELAGAGQNLPTIVPVSKDAPWLWVSKISGKVDELSEVIRDLVIQAEYQHHIGNSIYKKPNANSIPALTYNFETTKNIYGGELSFFTLYVNQPAVGDLELDYKYYFSATVPASGITAREGYIYPTYCSGDGGAYVYTHNFTHGWCESDKVVEYPSYFSWYDYIGTTGTRKGTFPTNNDIKIDTTHAVVIVQGQTDAVIDFGELNLKTSNYASKDDCLIIGHKYCLLDLPNSARYEPAGKDSLADVYNVYANWTPNTATYKLGRGTSFNGGSGGKENAIFECTGATYPLLIPVPFPIAVAKMVFQICMSNMYIGKSCIDIHPYVISNSCAKTVIFTDRNFSPRGTYVNNQFGDTPIKRSIWGHNFYKMPLLSYMPAINLDGGTFDIVGSNAGFFISECPSLEVIPEISNIPNVGHSFMATATSNPGILKVVAPMENVPIIGDNFLRSTTSIEKFYSFANNLTTVGQNAFYGDTSLRYVKVPPTATGLGKGFCNDCPSLEIVYLPVPASTFVSVNYPKGFYCLAPLRNNPNLRIYVPPTEVANYVEVFCNHSPSLPVATFVGATEEEMEVLQGYESEFLQTKTVEEVITYHKKRMTTKAEEKKAKEEERQRKIEEYRKQGDWAEKGYQRLKGKGIF